MANRNLSAAKSAKNDEFYTQYADIQKDLVVIDPYFDDTCLPLIAQKRPDVAVTVVRSAHPRR